MSLLCLKPSSGFLSPSEQWSTVPSELSSPTHPSSPPSLCLPCSLNCSHTDLLALYWTHSTGSCLAFALVCCLWNALYQILQDLSHHLLIALLNSDVSLPVRTSWTYLKKKKKKSTSLSTASITYAPYPVIFPYGTYCHQMWGQGFYCVYCCMSSALGLCLASSR